MAEEGELGQGAGWDPHPSPALCSLPGPSMEVQSYFSQSGQGGHLTSFLLPASLSPTRLNPKAYAWTEPRGSTELTSLSFC